METTPFYPRVRTRSPSCTPTGSPSTPQAYGSTRQRILFNHESPLRARPS